MIYARQRCSPPRLPFIYLVDLYIDLPPTGERGLFGEMRRLFSDLFCTLTKCIHSAGEDEIGSGLSIFDV